MGTVSVFIPEEEPQSGSPEADVLARLERKFFTRLVDVINGYYESQADGVDVADCVEGAMMRLDEITASPEAMRLRRFADMFNLALSSGPGEG